MIVQWGDIFGRMHLYQAKNTEGGRKRLISLSSPFGYGASIGVQPTAAACKNLLDFSDGHRGNEFC